MLIKRLPPNLKGRDFVCGDIHGTWDLVAKFLDRIYFDISKDRLICAGDLIDRGPDNVDCMKLLYEYWFHMTKGNHEELMEDYFTDSPMGIWWLQNGGFWGACYKTDRSDDAIFVQGAVEDVIAKLPYLITVEKKDGSLFHVLHAELKPQLGITDEVLADEEKFKAISTIQTHDGDTVMWGRYVFIKFYKKTMTDEYIRKIKRAAQLEKLDILYNDKLSHIYSGHTIVKQPTQFYGQTNLDTMAYGSYSKDAAGWEGLTFTEPETGRFWLVNPKEFKEVSPLVIKGE